MRGRFPLGAILLMAIAGVTGTGRVAVRAQQPPPVTFTGDVAPIVFASCATCHRPDGSAPFSLLTYADAKARADPSATKRCWKPTR